ncbi:putative chymotrypsin-like elastase family member 3B [Scophthalmus maximus]|uniref:Putative chymotrypsin-like elastase family member 3B n=1 Tax=Scophthalmus maximus TaxID=52904 RepID=A0A2U9C5P8_SCOMX|nr:putative chymotrypsin-like elastase family member 3B [Scophthalmus maximus]
MMMIADKDREEREQSREPQRLERTGLRVNKYNNPEGQTALCFPGTSNHPLQMHESEDRMTDLTLQTLVLQTAYAMTRPWMRLDQSPVMTDGVGVARPPGDGEILTHGTPCYVNNNVTASSPVILSLPRRSRQNARSVGALRRFICTEK